MEPLSIPPAHQSLKIAIVHYACAPIVGGVEQIMSTHARLLRKAGHRPYIVAGRGEPELLGIDGVILPQLDSRHPEIVAIQKALLAGDKNALDEFEIWTERIFNLLRETLQDADISIVHNAFTLHKNLPLTVALARLAETSMTTGWVAWCHDLAWNNPLYAGELRHKWPWTPLKYCLPNVTYVAISNVRRNEMAALFRVPPESITLIPNGIDPEAFLPCAPEMREIKDTFRWESRDWVLLAPLRVTRRKNLEHAIDIVAAMRDLGADPLLVITGPPGPHNVRSHEYLDELLQRRHERHAEDLVAFLAIEGREGGFRVSDDLMTELYQWADALIIPSMQEGFGLPLLEAGIARMPIFCSDIPVMREVGGPSAHYFSPEGDPLEIAREILKVLNTPGPALHRRTVLRNYGWASIVDEQIEPMLQDIMRNPKGTSAITHFERGGTTT